MKIIIVGNGKVGYAIARQLAVEGHDITMVDSSPVALARADSTLDIMCVEGNGASISVLEEAGARTADLVIAVSNLDETNLVCCLIAKTMGAKHTIARVRNPDYRRDAALLKREIGMDMVINPDLAAAREIARILSFPSASSVEPFAGGRIDMIGIQVTERDRFYGVALSEFHRIRSAEVLICAAQRGTSASSPTATLCRERATSSTWWVPSPSSRRCCGLWAAPSSGSKPCPCWGQPHRHVSHVGAGGEQYQGLHRGAEAR